MTQLLWIEIAGTPLVLLLLVWIAQPKQNPLLSLVDALRWALGSRPGICTTLLLAGVLGLNLIQSFFDADLSKLLGYDLTEVVFALEGSAVAQLQEICLPLLPDPLLLGLSAFYLAGFIATLLLPLALFHGDGDASRNIRRAWVATFCANYLLALPFYSFLPVIEVGWFDGSGARAVMEEVLPGLTAALRNGSALDNCFPSLHVSCTASVWWLARRLRAQGLPTKGLARAAGLSAALTAVTVVLLGIHWISDVVAGLVFGIACCELALVYSASQRAAWRA